MERANTYKEYSDRRADRAAAVSRNRSNRLLGLPLVPQPDPLSPPLIPVAYGKDGTYEGRLDCIEDLPEGCIVKWQEAKH